MPLLAHQQTEEPRATLSPLRGGAACHTVSFTRRSRVPHWFSRTAANAWHPPTYGARRFRQEGGDEGDFPVEARQAIPQLDRVMPGLGWRS